MMSQIIVVSNFSYQRETIYTLRNPNLSLLLSFKVQQSLYKSGEFGGYLEVMKFLSTDFSAPSKDQD